MTQDLNYYESGYIETGYYTYTADAESTIGSQVTVSIIATRIQDGTANLNTAFTQSCTISHIEGADLFAFTEASLAAQVDRIRDVNTSVSGVFSTAIDGTRVRYVSAEEDASTSVDITFTRTRNDEAALDAAFSSSTANERVRYVDSSLTSTATQTVDFTRVKEEVVTLACESSISATLDQYGVTKEGAADLTSTFTQDVTAYRIIEASCECDALFTPNITCNPVRNTVAVLDATTGLTSIAEVTRDNSVSLTTTAELTSSIDKFAGINAEFTTAFTQVTSFDRTRDESADLTSVANTSLDITRIIQGSCNVDALFTPNITCNPVRNTVAVLDATTGLTAVIEVNKTFASALTSTASISASGDKTVGFIVTTTSTFTQSTVTNRTRNFNSTFVSTANLSLIFTRIVQGESHENALFTPSITANPIKNHFAHLEAIASMTINAVKEVSAVSSMSSVATQSTTALRFKGITSDLSSAFTESSYGAFTNKHPRTTYTYPGTSGISLDSTYKKYGTHSLRVNSTTNSFRITTADHIVPGSSDFYVSVWLKTTSVIGTGYVPVINAPNWDIGYYKGSITPYFRYTSGGVQSVISLATTYSTGFDHWEVIRSGTTVTFKVTTSTGGSNTYSKSVDVFNSDPGASSIILGGTGSYYFDEFYYAIGVSAPVAYKPSGEIDDGAQPTTQALFHFNGDYYADTSGTKTASANLQAFGNVTITANVDNVDNVDLHTTSSLTINVNTIREISSQLNISSSLIANNRRTLNVTSNQLIESSISCTVDVIRLVQATFTAFYTELTVNGRIRADVADLDVIASLNSTASKFNGATISLDSTATQTADVTRIKPLAANLTDAFNFVATCISDIEAQATIESTTSAEINASRIRDVDAEFTAFYTELTVNTRTRDEVANLTSTFNINAIINLTSENTVNASSQASLNAIAVRAKGLSSVQELTSTLSATATRTASLVSQQDATTSESIEYIRYRNFDATFTAFYTELTVNSRIRAEVADLDCEFTIYAKGNVQGANASDMESTVSITAQAQRTRNIVSNQEVISSIIVATGPVYRTTVDLDAVISQTSEVDKTTDVVINLQAFNTQVTANARTRNEVASLVTTSTMAITAVRAKGLIAPLTAQITETAIATRIKPLVSAMNAITAITLVGGKSVQAQANLQAYFTPVINTNIIHITAELTYVIPAELSEWIIGVDSRDWTISQETREYTI